METRLLNEKENKLLGRKELSYEVVYVDIPPNRQQVKTEIVKQQKVDDKLVIIKKMANVFGTRKMMCTVNVYTNLDDLTRLEPKHLSARLKTKDGGTEAPKEEKPSEKKEEPKK